MKTRDNERAGDRIRTGDSHLGKIAVCRWKRNGIGVTVVGLYFLCFALFAVAAKDVGRGRNVHGTVNTERIVNDTLDTIMWVDSQHHGKYTWAQLNSEVCKQMKVRRTEPWQRK